MKETFYFTHDYNARSDDKIKMLIRRWGMAGYGVFWAIVEDLYNNANAMRLQYDGIAYDLHVSAEMVKSIINDFDLFLTDNDVFGSESVERRINDRNEKSKKASLSASKRWEKHKIDANAMRTQCERNAIKESKVKEIKVKDNIAVEKTTALYPEFISLYNDFILQKTSVPAKIDGQQGKAAKELISYIKKAVSVKNPEPTNEDVLNGWKHILASYERWDSFHKGQLKLSQINSNITNIINSIKNGTPNGRAGKQPATSFAEIDAIVDRAFADKSLRDAAEGNQ